MQGINERLERVLSRERLSGYTTNYAGQHDCSPLTLYRWNILLSESLYPSLQVIEVVLRNILYQAITEHFNDHLWLKDQTLLEPKEINEVFKQEALLRKTGDHASLGKIIAELNFGFWTSLLDSRYEMKLWRSKIIKKAFPNMPTQIRMRHHISKHFNQIRKLRNRIFHHEPIWHWQDLKEQHSNIQKAITWIEPQALLLCQPDRFIKVYEAGPISLEKKVG